jgi:hypothetical protein
VTADIAHGTLADEADAARGFVSIVGSTDMPGRTMPASGSPLSTTIFTGMRWTILVKLPVALSGGSSANSWPLAGARLL